MPTFDTPTPITAKLDLVAADVRIGAADIAATSITVEPSDPASDEDRKAAEHTRVDFADGELVVKSSKLRSWRPGSHGGSIDVTIALPARSHVDAHGSLAEFTCDGPLGICDIRTGLGSVSVDEAQSLKVRTGVGGISVGRVIGRADIVSGSGEIRVRELADTAVIKNSNGDTSIGIARGELRVAAANGDIAIDAAQGGVVAKSSNGNVRLAIATRKSIVLETKLGDVEVGVPQGTAAWLDVRSSAGRVVNGLDAASAPDAGIDKVDVRARTSAGDVLIRRA